MCDFGGFAAWSFATAGSGIRGMDNQVGNMGEPFRKDSQRLMRAECLSPAQLCDDSFFPQGREVCCVSVNGTVRPFHVEKSF